MFPDTHYINSSLSPAVDGVLGNDHILHASRLYWWLQAMVYIFDSRMLVSLYLHSVLVLCQTALLLVISSSQELIITVKQWLGYKFPR